LAAAVDLIVPWFVGFLIRDNQLDLLRHWFLLLAPYGGTLRHIAAEIALRCGKSPLARAQFRPL
jgi:hypothetical protein